MFSADLSLLADDYEFCCLMPWKLLVKSLRKSDHKNLKSIVKEDSKLGFGMIN